MNFDGMGTALQNQITQFDINGDKIDAHDGKIMQVGKTFYLYGTSYGCGFSWHSDSTSPFCGFVSYSTQDLVNWTPHGLLFDPNQSPWPSICNGNSNGGGCFEPKMVYNEATQKYLLWFFGYAESGTKSALFVMTCASPTGGCTNPKIPTLHACPNFNCNMSDHNIFVDDDPAQTAYIVYNNYPQGIYVEQLSSDYTETTGNWVQAVPGGFEGLGIFKNKSNKTYYVTYGPSCGYCSATATKYDYTTASNPLTGWQIGGTLNPNSCGGQPFGVDPITVNGTTYYVYQSDLWVGQGNEAIANRFYDTLSFNGNLINPINCDASMTIPGLQATASSFPTTAPNQSDLNSGSFGVGSDISSTTIRMQTFVPNLSGTITSVAIITGQTNFGCSISAIGSPCPDVNGDLTVSLVSLDANNQPVQVLGSGTVVASAASWAPQEITIPFNVPVTAGAAYGIELVGENSLSAWEYAFSNDDPYPAGVELMSTNGGSTWTIEPGKSLGFSVTVGPIGTSGCSLAESPASGFVASGSEYFFNLTFGTTLPSGATVVWNGTRNGAIDAVNVAYGESNINQFGGTNNADGSSAGTYTRSFSVLDRNGNIQCQSNSVTTNLAPSASPPTTLTASLTANGMKNTSFSASVGETISYTWLSTNATSATCTYSIDGAGSYPWVCENSLSGIDSGTVASSQAGHTYKISYVVTSASGQTATSYVTVVVAP
jgi:hypothetical protein